MPRFIQDSETGRLVEVTTRQSRARSAQSADAPAVIPDIEPFISPIDGTLITSRRDLRVHQEQHDVRSHGEYGDNHGEDYFKRASAERNVRGAGGTRRDREERIAALKPIVERLDR